MNKYGYLLNLEYKPQEGEVLWHIMLNETVLKIGIEGQNLETNENFVIIGNAQQFNAWLQSIQNPIPIM